MRPFWPPSKAAPRLIWRGFWDAFLPVFCGACDATIGKNDAEICDTCLAALHTTGANYCRRCGSHQGPYVGAIDTCNACRELPADWPLDEVVALGEHREILRDAVVKLKFHGRHRNAALLGKMLAELVRQRGLELDCVVPLPLAWRRRFDRGYDQAELIAYALARELDLPMLRHALRRKKRTKPQTTLSAAQRQANVRSAFVAGKDGAAIAGKRILLVDDVLTTGATLHAAGKVLRRLKAAKVCAAVLSRSEH